MYGELAIGERLPIGVHTIGERKLFRRQRVSGEDAKDPPDIGDLREREKEKKYRRIRMRIRMLHVIDKKAAILWP